MALQSSQIPNAAVKYFFKKLFEQVSSMKTYLLIVLNNYYVLNFCLDSNILCLLEYSNLRL